METKMKCDNCGKQIELRDSLRVEILSFPNLVDIESYSEKRKFTIKDYCEKCLKKFEERIEDTF
jgi:hypothetical protein